jgi:hypothetical protein
MIVEVFLAAAFLWALSFIWFGERFTENVDTYTDFDRWERELR